MDILFDRKYAGKVGMMSDPQELGSVGLLALGIDPATSTESDWAKAAKKLQQQKSDGIVRAYYDQSYIGHLKNGDTVVTQAWSGDIFQADLNSKYADLKFMVPQQGMMFWTDNMCIPLYAQNPKDAMALMDYYYSPGRAGRGRVLQRLRVPGALGPAGAAEPDRLGGDGAEGDEARDRAADVGDGERADRVPDRRLPQGGEELLPVQDPGRADRVEQPVRADHTGQLAVRRRRVRPGKVLAPYLLSLPAGLWLLILFLIPLVVMLSLSLQTCNPATGACVMTWHWAEFGQQLSLYHTQFITSIWFAGAATLICLVVSFPIAYWIAFYGGNRKNFFLLMLLVPFFVSFVIRTVVWQFILSDQGIILGALKNIGLLPQSFHVLATGWAVIAGLSYNYLPFTALPLYVAIERIDKRVLDAAYDLYATKRQAFLRVILPLTIPGIFAAFLLTFIPALGDYVNQQILGGTGDTMIGTVIQNSFLTTLDYPGGSALSTVLMAVALIGIFAYARILGSRTIEEYL